jgi:hypothetical protein
VICSLGSWQYKIQLMTIMNLKFERRCCGVKSMSYNKRDNYLDAVISYKVMTYTGRREWSTNRGLKETRGNVSKELKISRGLVKKIQEITGKKILL